MRGAFYYAWYPEQWGAAGHHWTPLLGLYNSGDAKIIQNHIDMMQYANIDVGIYSWQGPSSPEDQRFSSHLSAGFKWAIYYETDYKGDRSLNEVHQDMLYCQKYFDHPNYLKISGKPVVFVYNPMADVTTAAKWSTIRQRMNLWVSLADYPEWWTANPVDAWHGYRPDHRAYSVYLSNHVYGISVSAGFWSAAESTARLDRDFTQWEQGVAAWQLYKPDWELVYFNEFGEGTNIEPSNACCSMYLCGDYLQTLHQT